MDEFLTDEMVRGRETLDVGCGLDFFSERLQQRGALRLVEHFGPERFDLVVSSECIEHTPDAAEALRQMGGVLKPGGLRPFDGFEDLARCVRYAAPWKRAGSRSSISGSRSSIC